MTKNAPARNHCGKMRAFAFMLAIAACSTGCQRNAHDESHSYADFVKALCDPLRVADLSTPQAEIVTSFDPQGKNNDFNNFPHHRPKDVEQGWIQLADLRGPGFLSRFWTTGGESADQRLRFYFDDETTARFDATVKELRSGMFPFVAPLSRYEQSCWWSYVPMTYAKRLRILAKHDKTTHDGWPRLFFQVNYSSFNKGYSVATLPAAFDASDKLALSELATLWNSSAEPRSPASPTLTSLDVPPGEEGATLPALDGPAIITDLTIVPPDAQRAKSLVLQILWDDALTPAILLPLPLLGGRLWDAPPYSALFFGEQDGRTTLKYPMPFHKRARISILNRSTEVIQVQVGLETRQWPDEKQPLGYLHSQWNRSSPQQRGQPHPILQAKGAEGKYMGAIVGALSLDNSWWVLEGDESIRIDGETQAGWHGTGLEDYFNGGWYYKNNLARPIHGLAFKSLYKAVQYRLHREDARRFSQSIDVSLERGPDNASQAWIESVSYYYSKDPQGTPTLADRLPELVSPPNPLEKLTLMSDLCNYERFGGYVLASAWIDEYLTRYPDTPFAQILRLRQVAYQHHFSDMNTAREAFTAFEQSTSEPNAKSYAKLLAWYNEDASHALLSLFCSSPAKAYIDGIEVSSTSDPRIFRVVPIKLSDGNHTLAVETAQQQYPDWIQACLHTHSGDVLTQTNWRFSIAPKGNWTQLDHDISAWQEVGDSQHEGPPPAPHIVTSPHPFVDMQALPLAIWTSVQWPPAAKTAGFRSNFTFPIEPKSDKVGSVPADPGP